MSDLISRSKLLEGLKSEGYNPYEHEEDSYDEGWAKGFNAGIAHSMQHVLCSKTVDAVPVVKGKWLYNDFIKEWECSNCHSSISLSDDRNSHPNFCPNCGADMRKKVGE